MKKNNEKQKKYVKNKHIIISKKNYQILKNLGKTGDSFNDVLNHILNNSNSQQSKGLSPPIDC